MDLHFHVGRLFVNLPPVWTIIDGIFSNERGPGFDGIAKRTNLLIASSDLFSADKVGAAVLGYSPSDVPHLVHASQALKRPLDLSDLDVTGESLESLIMPHRYSFDYNQDNSLPLVMEKAGIRGISYWKYDDTLCTYCSFLNGTILTAIARAWKGTPWDEVEVLTGKVMNPSGMKKHTILLGKCMSDLHKNNPYIRHAVFVKGCPPKPKDVVKAFQEVGIELDMSIFEHPEHYAARFMKKYEGKSEFDEAFFKLE
jgi:Ni,Fe-hydrogenase III small subunit